MPRGVKFTENEKKVLREIMNRAWQRKRGSKPGSKRVYLNPKRELSIFDKHQLNIARKTLLMSDAGARIMGPPSKAEAREIIYRLTGKRAKE